MIHTDTNRQGMESVIHHALTALPLSEQTREMSSENAMPGASQAQK